MYFGEKVGIYFAWLGYYTSQLIPAAIVGLVAFIYGLATFLDDANSCIYSRVTYLFDNPATVAFAGFMALWATVFAEMWKRRTAEIEYDWDVADYEEEETVRPEYEASVKKRRVNPINKLEEPYLSFASRACRYLSSLWVILFMVTAVFGVIVYRMTVSALLFAVNQEQVSKWSSTITSITAACINLVCIILLGKFVNHYGSLIYIAFFKGKFIGRPGDYNREINDKRQEECDPAGCLIELLIQLGIIMVGKQAINNAKEFLLPKVMNWFKGRRVKEEEEKASKPLARWEKDYSMACMPDLGLFEEYLEMVLQYGFVTLFVAAFPLAPFFALLNNVIEIRLDAYKYRDFREPPGSPREYQFTMEYWHVLTARLAFIISFILVIVFLQWLISFLVPDIPRFVKMMMLREKYLAKEAILASEALRPDNLDGGTSSRNVNGSGNVLTHRKSPAAQRPGAGSFPSEQPLY
nr:hypothetical protein BaRGS_020551 [Batillaria attramentaria]